MPRARRELQRAEGLVVGRVLGTARGRSTAGGADLRRWALFAVWEDADAHDAFARSRLAMGWAPLEERWAASLAPRRSRGAWGGIDPFRAADLVDGGGPVAVLTRASVAPRRLAAFHLARRPVDDALRSTAGLRRVVGMGEWPVGRQATFSVWEDDRAVRGFAVGEAVHRSVVARTSSEGWYPESLFAAFSIRAHAGSWDGADPASG